MATIVDSYSESNLDSVLPLSQPTYYQAVGQSFTGDGGTLNSVKFYLTKWIGSPTGNATVDIYTHSGTFGTSSVPTGISLATSGNFDVSAITAILPSFELISFTFSGDNKIVLENGTRYVVIISHDGTDANCIAVGIDDTSPAHSGNMCLKFSGIWYSTSIYDACFYVYKDDAATSVKDIIGPGLIAFPR